MVDTSRKRPSQILAIPREIICALAYGDAFETVGATAVCYRNKFSKNACTLAQVLVKSGKPSEEIIQAAKDVTADLILLYAHPERQIEHVHSHDTMEHVARSAPCPVMDPKEQMVGAFMTQRRPDVLGIPAFILDFWTSAYQLIDD